jgi:glycosyltransferase involved in cell wall biosynthesis
MTISLAAGYANLRLAVVSPFVDRRHGTERAIAELLERLASNFGCEIHLYAQRVEDLALSDRAKSRDPNAGALLWRRVPSVPGPHLLQFLSWFLLNRFCRTWDHFFHGFRFDLVFSAGINCLDADVILVHAIFRRLAELHEDAASSGLRTVHRTLYYRLLRFLERRVYGNSPVVLAAVSQRTAVQLDRYFGRSGVPVIPNGVDTHIFHPAARLARRSMARQRWQFAPHEQVLLLIGNDWKNKGLPVLLEAAAQCGDLPLRLLIVGEEDPATFVSAISKLQLADRVSFSGPSANVLDFFAAADVYVAPSLEDSFNLPVLEAMACSLPIIVSINAGVHECIRDRFDGLLLRNPQDSSELAAALRNLLEDPESMLRLGENAAQTGTSLSWDRNAAAIYQLLCETCDLCDPLDKGDKYTRSCLM